MEQLKRDTEIWKSDAEKSVTSAVFHELLGCATSCVWFFSVKLKYFERKADDVSKQLVAKIN